MPPASKSRPGSARKNPIALHILLSVAALACAGGAKFWIDHQFRQLPAGRAAAIGAASINAAQREAVGGGGRDVRDAVQILTGGIELAGIDRPRADIGRIESNVAQVAARMTTTGVGRLHQACARLAVLERSGQPVDAWWPAVQPYLAGLERSTFNHHQLALRNGLYTAFVRAGLPSALAREYAVNGIGETQGPFMQSLVGRLRRLIANRAAANDVPAVATCRSILLRWLREWTLEAGATGLRLTAAQLLAESLSDPVIAAGHAGAAEAAAAAANWRQRYRTAAHAAPPVLFGIVSGPSVIAAEEQRVVSVFSWAGYFAGAGATLAVAALLLVVPLRRAPVPGGAALKFVIAAVLLAIVGAVAMYASSRADCGYDGVQMKFMRLTSDIGATSGPAHGRWHPYYARWMPPILGGAGGLIGVLMVVAVGRFAGSIGPATSARATCLAAMFCGVCALGFCASIRGAISNMDQQRAVAMEAGLISRLIGPQSDALLQPVRDMVP